MDGGQGPPKNTNFSSILKEGGVEISIDLSLVMFLRIPQKDLYPPNQFITDLFPTIHYFI
jgi:hypothetical protein